MEATNITELLWSDSLCATLRLCGADERQIGTAASDYEKFRALCYAMPLCSGHPLPIQLGAFLRDHFDLTLLPSPETCDLLWRLCADKLSGALFHNHLPMQSIPDATAEWIPPVWHMLQTVSVLDGMLLLNTEADSWCAWELEMRARLEGFFEAGGRFVAFSPASDVCDKTPSVYHIDLALKRKDDIPVRMAQILRFLSIELQKRNMTLLLDADRSGEGIVSFLSRMERSVGLPRIVWMSGDRPTRDALLQWQACAHSSEIRYAVREKIPETDLREIAARYPVGRLWMVDDGKSTGWTLTKQIYDCRTEKY